MNTLTPLLLTASLDNNNTVLGLCLTIFEIPVKIPATSKTLSILAAFQIFGTGFTHITSFIIAIPSFIYLFSQSANYDLYTTWL